MPPKPPKRRKVRRQKLRQQNERLAKIIYAPPDQARDDRTWDRIADLLLRLLGEPATEEREN